MSAPLVNRTLLVSDTHFGNLPEFATFESGFSSRFELQLEAFKEILIWSRQKRASRMVHLGDVFHFRGQVPPEVLNRVRALLENYTDHLTEIVVLTGNHDITVEGQWFNNAYTLHGTVGGKVSVVSGVQKIGDELFIAFTKRDFKEVLKASTILGTDGGTLYMHQSVFGADYNKTIMKGVQPGMLTKQFKHVFCGHIHFPQAVAGVTIVGAPWPLTFGDDRHYRALVVDDRTKRIVEELEPRHPRFITTDNPVVLEQDTYNFYRLTGVKAGDVHDAPNVRVVPEVVTKKLVRVKARSDRELLEAWCRKKGIPEREIKSLVQEGLRYMGKE